MTKSAGRRAAFGTAMRQARRELKLTQRALATRLVALGDDVTEQALSGYERGEYAPDVDRARRIEQVLGVELVGLLGLPDETVSITDIDRRLRVVEEQQAEILRRLERQAAPRSARSSPRASEGGRPTS